MRITECRIKPMDEDTESNERLLAFASITFDNAFVVRDLRIIEGAQGTFIAMPSRKLADRCHNCGTKNHLRARYCNSCGERLPDNRALRNEDGTSRLHADTAHPINEECRRLITQAVLAAYAEEVAAGDRVASIGAA